MERKSGVLAPHLLKNMHLCLINVAAGCLCLGTWLWLPLTLVPAKAGCFRQCFHGHSCIIALSPLLWVCWGSNKVLRKTLLTMTSPMGGKAHMRSPKPLPPLCNLLPASTLAGWATQELTHWILTEAKTASRHLPSTLITTYKEWFSHVLKFGRGDYFIQVQISMQDNKKLKKQRKCSTIERMKCLSNSWCTRKNRDLWITWKKNKKVIVLRRHSNL